jgi:hypothetical protein
MICFASVFALVLIILAGINHYAYPLTKGLLVLSFFVMLYGGFQLYFYTSFVGMQHVKNRVPDITLPLHIFTFGNTMLNNLMEIAMHSDEEILKFKAQVSKKAQQEQQAKMLDRWWAELRRRVEAFIDPGYTALDRTITLRVSGEDLIIIKKHLWAEYWDPRDDGFDPSASHLERARALSKTWELLRVRVVQTYGSVRAAMANATPPLRG